MLDKIQSNISENIAQSQNLEKVKGLGVSNPYETNDKGFFIDQYDISETAMQKYQKELDIAHFKEIFNNTDEKRATEKVVKEVFNGQISLEEETMLSELLNNKEFLNDIFE